MLDIIGGMLLELPIALFGEDKSKKRSRIFLILGVVTILVAIILVNC